MTNLQGYYNRGVLFDCGSLTARIFGTTLSYIVTQNLNGVIVTKEIDVMAVANPEYLMQWMNFAFSFKNQQMILHINGVQVASQLMNSTTMSYQGPTCTIGNSNSQSNPFTGSMRHVVFSQQGYNVNSTITTQIKSVSVPSDQNVLAAFHFQKNFGNQDTYYFNSSRNYVNSNVISGWASEPETVCYCTSIPQSYLKVTSSLQFVPFNMIAVNQQGLTLQFQIYPLKLDNGNYANQSLISIQNYIDVNLVNNSQSIRVDLYNSGLSLAASLVFKNFRFRFQFWTQYQIVITSSSASLYIDGTLIDMEPHSVPLPTSSSALVIQQPVSLEYLLNNITVLNTQGKACFNQTFTQQLIMPKFNAYQNTSGNPLLFETNNRMCFVNGAYNSSLYLSSSGTSCIDNRAFPLFGPTSGAQLNSTSLVGVMTSSQNSMTIEFWMKDMSPSSNQTSVILESGLGTSIVGQVALFSNSSNLNQRFLRVTPLQGYTPSLYLQSSTLNQTQGNWLHIAIVSNLTSMKIDIFNLTSSNLTSVSQNSISLYQSIGQLNTALGSSLSGLNKFIGQLRELRIWGYARLDSDLALYRFNSFYGVGNQLLYYFRLNSGDELYTIYDTNYATFIESSQNVTSLTWGIDQTLVLCQPGLFFNGICCQQVNLTGFTFSLAYSSTKSFIDVLITSTTAIPSIMGVYANFTLLSLGFYNDSATTNQIQSLFTVNHTSGFNVSTTLINPVVYNMTVQARIYSIYSQQYITVNQSLTLQCPLLYIQINNAAPNIQSQTQYLVSTQPNTYISLKLASVQNVSTCYNPATNSVQPVSVNQIVWSQTLSPANAAFPFQNVWTPSSDNTSVTFNQVAMTGQAWTKVSAMVYYNVIKIMQVSINLTYTSVWPVNPNFANASFIRNYLPNQLAKIDFSNTTSSDMVNYPNLTFGVVCPQSLFSSQLQYQQLCQFQGTTFKIDQSQLSPLFTQAYPFIFYIGILGTNIIRQIQGNFTYFQDGSSLSSCPQVLFTSQYQYDKVQNQSVNLSMNPYLYCNGVFYDPLSISWTLQDQNTSKLYNNLINQTAYSPFSLAILNSNTALKSIVSGSSYNLSVSLTTAQANLTSIISPVKTLSIIRNTTVSIKKNPLVPNITTTSYNKMILNPLNLGFLAPNFTLNASSSYDPDNSSSILNFSWTCPSQISIAACKSIQSGARNNSLVIPTALKISSGLPLASNETIALSISSSDNKYASNSSLAYNVNFALPQANDTVPPEMMSTQCETLSIQSTDFNTSDTADPPNTIIYNINDWSSHTINVNAMIDSNQNVAKSPCGYANVEYQYLYMYAFNNLQQPAFSTLFSQTTPSVAKLTSLTIQSSSFPNLQTLFADTPLQVNLYMFTKRLGSNQLFTNLASFYFLRQYAPLIANVASSQITVDQYATFTIDASSSYDSENTTNTNFTYVWACPQFGSSTPTHCNTIGSLLTINYQDRMTLQANQIGMQYAFTVQIVEDKRQSAPVQVIVIITAQSDYSSCITINEQIDFAPLTYSFSGQNRTIFVDQNETITISIINNVSTTCYTSQIVSNVWSNQAPGISNFWQIVSANPNEIQFTQNTLKSLTPGQLNTVLFTSTVQFANDSTQQYYQTLYYNIYVNPNPIVPIVIGRAIFSPDANSAITLDGSQSFDPMNESYTCNWDCPPDFGGPQCTSNCSLQQNFVDLQSLVLSQQSATLSYLYDTALPYTLTVTSSDGVRSAQSTNFVYMIDQPSESEPFNEIGIQNCSIKMYGNSTSSQIFNVISQLNVFYLACDSTNLTSFIISPFFAAQWNVLGLTPSIDYYSQNNQLFIKPYALAKLSSVNSSFVITLSITSTNSSSNTHQRRVLQNASQTTDNTTTVTDPSLTNDTSATTSSNQDNSTDPNAQSIDQTDIGSSTDQNATDQSNITSDQSTDQQTATDQSNQTSIDQTNSTTDNSTDQTNQTDNTTDITNQTSTDNSDQSNSTDNTTNDTGSSTLSTDNSTNSNDNTTNITDNSTITTGSNTANSTNQTSNTSSAPPQIMVSSQRKYTDSTLKSQFTFQRNILTFGTINVVSQGSGFTEYVSNFTFSFSNFSASPQSTILFQLRAFQDALYNTSQIIIPIKPFTQHYVDQYYNQTNLPLASSLWLDFFDGNLNYLGSENLKAVGGPLEFFTVLGQMSYNQADKIITNIESKSFVGYMGTNAQNMAEFDQDMKRVLEIVEFTALGGVSDISGVGLLVDTMANQIITYLKINFQQMIQLYDISNVYQYRQKLIIQKRTILIFFNLLQLSRDMQQYILPVLNIVQLATSDLYNLCYNSGEDAQYLISVVTWIEQTLNVQLNTVSVQNKNLYYNIIYNLSNTVSQTVVQNQNNSTQKVQQISSSTSSLTIYQLNNSSQAPLLISNQNNPLENVTFSGTEGALASSLNISSVYVEYDQTNTTYVGNQLQSQSIITIKAYDAGGNVLNVSFPQNQSYFQLSFQLQSKAVANISLQNATLPGFQLQCIYYNVKTNTWASDGVQLSNYDPVMGVASCQAFHLTQFSIQIVPIIYTPPPQPPPVVQPNNTNTTTNNQTNADNQTGQTNDTTGDNSTLPPILIVNNTIDITFQTFFMQNPSNYIAAIIVISGLTILASGFVLFFCRYNEPKNGYSATVSTKPIQGSSIRIQVWTILKIYHPLLASIFPQINPTLAIPRGYQLLSLILYLFSIVLSSLIHIVYVTNDQSDYDTDNNSIVVIYAAVYFAVFRFLRPLFSKIRYSFYHHNAVITEAKVVHKVSRESVYEQASLKEETSHPSPFNTQKPRSALDGGPRDERLSDEHFDQFEGGESLNSDNEYIEGSESSHSDRKEQHQRYPGPNEDIPERSQDFNTRNPRGRQQEYMQPFSEQVPSKHHVEMEDQALKEESKLNETDNAVRGGMISTRKEQQDHQQICIDKPGTPLDTDGNDYDSRKGTLSVNQYDINIDFNSVIATPEQSIIEQQTNQTKPIIDNENPLRQVVLQQQYQSQAKLSKPKVSAPQETEYVIRNDHHINGARIILLALMILIIIGEMVAFYVIMDQVNDQDVLNAWVQTCIAMSLVNILGVDTIFCLLFAIVFRHSKSEAGLKSWPMRISSALLVGNADFRARISVNLEIKG